MVFVNGFSKDNDVIHINEDFPLFNKVMENVVFDFSWLRHLASDSLGQDKVCHPSS